MKRANIFRLGVVGLTGFAIFVAVGYSLIDGSLSADRAFTQIQLGDTRASVITVMGQPMRQVTARELDRYSDCEVEEVRSIQSVDIWVKGVDMIYLIGYSDQRVAAKCSAAW